MRTLGCNTVDLRRIDDLDETAQPGPANPTFWQFSGAH